MELKKRFDFKIVFFSIYVIAFLIYLGISFLPAEATDYIADSKLEIPTIGLMSDVVALELREGNLDTPDFIVGSFSKWENKILLIGHSTTVFKKLNEVKLRDEIIYDDKIYKVIERTILAKDKISMNKVLKSEARDTLVIMTCAGELLEDQDATHRLMITAIEL